MAADAYSWNQMNISQKPYQSEADEASLTF